MYIAAGSSMSVFSYILNVSDGIVSALCTSQLSSISQCSIQFSRDAFYNNLSTPTIGPINAPFKFPFTETPSALYYHQASVAISDLEIIVRSSEALTLNIIESTTEYSTTLMLNESSSACDVEGAIVMEVYQLGLLGLLFLILISALGVCCGITCCVYKGKYVIQNNGHLS